jgi:hypothetical protein
MFSVLRAAPIALDFAEQVAAGAIDEQAKRHLKRPR